MVGDATVGVITVVNVTCSLIIALPQSSYIHQLVLAWSVSGLAHPFTRPLILNFMALNTMLSGRVFHAGPPYGILVLATLPYTTVGSGCTVGATVGTYRRECGVLVLHSIATIFMHPTFGASFRLSINMRIGLSACARTIACWFGRCLVC